MRKKKAQGNLDMPRAFFVYKSFIVPLGISHAWYNEYLRQSAAT